MSVTYFVNASEQHSTDFNVSNVNHASIMTSAGLEVDYCGEVEFDRFLWGVGQTYLGSPYFHAKVEAAKDLVRYARQLGLTKLHFG